MTGGDRIEGVWVLVVETPHGDGLVCRSDLGGPVVALAAAQVDDLRRYAADYAENTGRVVQMVRYEHAEIVEVFGTQ